MLIAQMHLENGQFDDSVPIPNAQSIIRQAEKYGINKLGAMDWIPIDNLPRPSGFNDAILNQVYESLGDNHKTNLSVSDLMRAANMDGSALGCYAAEDHDDADISAFNTRWLIVVRCEPGFVLHAESDSGAFDIEIQTGMIIEFNESITHSLEALNPQEIKVSSPNIFYSIPAPCQLKKAA